MSSQTAAETTAGFNSDPLSLPRQMLEAARKSAILAPQIWQEGCAILAEAADEQAKLLHLLASAETPVAASAIVTDYWQNSAQRGFEAMTRLMTLAPKST
jgi:hypothetical protein